MIAARDGIDNPGNIPYMLIEWRERHHMEPLPASHMR